MILFKGPANTDTQIGEFFRRTVTTKYNSQFFSCSRCSKMSIKHVV